MELQTKTWRSLHELSEIKKDCYKTYMVTYQLGNWTEASVHLKEEFMGYGPLHFFHTDQTVHLILLSSK